MKRISGLTITMATTQQLLDELRRRAQNQSQGRCEHCGRLRDAKVCERPDVHQWAMTLDEIVAMDQQEKTNAV